MITNQSAIVEAMARAIHGYCCRTMVMTYLDADEDCTGLALAALTAAFPLIQRERDREIAGWQPIDTCEAWRTDHMRRVLAYWSTRGVCETYWDEDENFEDRPRGWVSPREGWRSPGDMCIPINQDAVTHWMPLPAPPTEAGRGPK